MKERWMALWVKKGSKTKRKLQSESTTSLGGTVSYTAQPAGIVRFCSGISRVFHPAKVTGTVEPSLTLHLRGAFPFKWSWQHFGKEAEVFFWILQKKSKFCQQFCPGKLYLTNTALARAGAASGLAEGASLLIGLKFWTPEIIWTSVSL